MIMGTNGIYVYSPVWLSFLRHPPGESSKRTLLFFLGAVKDMTPEESRSSAASAALLWDSPYGQPGNGQPDENETLVPLAIHGRFTYLHPQKVAVSTHGSVIGVGFGPFKKHMAPNEKRVDGRCEDMMNWTGYACLESWVVFILTNSSCGVGLPGDSLLYMGDCLHGSYPAGMGITWSPLRCCGQSLPRS